MMRVPPLFLVLLLATSLGSIASLTPGKTLKAKYKIRIGLSEDPVNWNLLHFSNYAPFEKHNIEVELIKYPSGKMALQGLLKGEVDVASAAGVPIVDSWLHNRTQFRVLSTIGSSDNEIKVVGRKDRGISNLPLSLANKKIGAQKNSAVHFFLHLLKIQQLGGLHFTISFFHKADLVPALLRGEVDAISTREPFLSEALSAAGTNAVVISSAGLYRKMFHLVASRKYIVENSQALDLFMHEFLKSGHNNTKHPERMQKELMSMFDTPRKPFMKIWNELNLINRLNKESVLSFEDIAHWFKGEESYKINFYDMLDTCHIKKHSPQSINIRVGCSHGI